MYSVIRAARCSVLDLRRNKFDEVQLMSCEAEGENKLATILDINSISAHKLIECLELTVWKRGNDINCYLELSA